MKDFYVEGGCGDAYIFLLKTLNLGKISIFHNVKQYYYKPTITEIYNLNKNITLKFTNESKEDITSDTHEGNMEFFPEFKVKSNIKLPKEYCVIQPHSGKYNELNCKKLSYESVTNLISNTKLPVVLLGNDLNYESIPNCINLIDKTTIKDCVFIIKNSKQFLAPEGLLSFIALSQKIPSIILYSSQEAIEKRIINTPWEKYIIKFIKVGVK